jgi:hypothetical protein
VYEEIIHAASRFIRQERGSRASADPHSLTSKPKATVSLFAKRARASWDGRLRAAEPLPDTSGWVSQPMQVLILRTIERQEINHRDVCDRSVGPTGEQPAAPEHAAKIALTRDPALLDRWPYLHLVALRIVVERVGEIMEQQHPAG